MKNIFLFVIISFAYHINFAQDWVQLEDYPGLGRNHPITFSIGTDGYVLAGQNEIGYYVIFTSTTRLLTHGHSCLIFLATLEDMLMELSTTERRM